MRRSAWAATARPAHARPTAGGRHRPGHQALALAGERLAAFGDRFTTVTPSMTTLPTCSSTSMSCRSTASFDLGSRVCNSRRGRPRLRLRPGRPLDMRMDQQSGLTAAEVVNTYAAADLAHPARLRRGSGPPDVASAIVREREKELFTTSGKRLVDLLRDAVPAASQRTGGHRQRTFQALRRGSTANSRSWGAPSCRDRGPPGRRPDRGPVPPLARGPHHQASARGGAITRTLLRDAGVSCPSTRHACGY